MMKNALLFLFILSNFILFAQESRELENIKAFSKAFGYVRYFHPSDEASQLDWNKFAIHGVAQVRDAKNDEELINRLEQLFEPIASSAKFSTVNTYIDIDEDIRSPREGDKLTYWQHVGLGIGTTKDREKPYISKRINKSIEIDESSKFGNLMSKIEAVKYRGLPFILKSYIKNYTPNQNKVQMWLRVDTEKGMGFFDNMRDRPISYGEWREYEIKGTIDDDAKFIAFGAFMIGRGKMAIDNFSLQVKTENGWIELTENGDFEEKSSLKDKRSFWASRGLGYEIQYTKEDVQNGKRAITIEYEGLTYTDNGKKLFDHNAKGFLIQEEKLSNSIKMKFPISLYLNKSGKTIAANDTAKYQGLASLLSQLNPDTSNQDLQLSNVLLAYNIVQHFYPYRIVTPINWEKAFEEALEYCLTTNEYRLHVANMKRFLAYMNDGHVWINAYGLGQFAPPLRWEMVKGRLIITDIFKEDLGLELGDVITHINETTAKNYIDSLMQFESASTIGHRMNKAERAALLGNESSILKVTVDGKVKNLVRSENYWERNRDRVQNEQLLEWQEDSILYLNLNLIPMDTINARMNEISKAKGIICDLRYYPKDNHEFIQHLLSEKDTNQSWMRIPRYMFPNQENIVSIYQVGWGFKPKQPYLGNRPIVFLTSSSAISYAESYMGMIEGYGLAKIVGEPTAGTNGNVIQVGLNGGVAFAFTGMIVYRHDGTLLYGNGIEPHYEVIKTREGIINREDEFLSRAIEVIKTKPKL